jgi:hypothetical protein
MKIAAIAADMLQKPAATDSYRVATAVSRTIAALGLSALRMAGGIALKVLQKLVLNRLMKLAEKVHYA